MILAPILLLSLAGVQAARVMRRRAGAASPTKALAELAERARQAQSSQAPPALAGRNRLYGASAIAEVLTEHLSEPAEAQVECDGCAVSGQVSWDGERLHFQTPAAGATLAGSLWLSARVGSLELSGFSRVVGVSSDGVFLSAPQSVELIDCRGPRRRAATNGPESLGLGFVIDGQQRACPVLELSRSGASVLVPQLRDAPGAGTRVHGALVFRDRGLVRVEAEIRHVNRVDTGVRVGLRFRDAQDGDCTVGDVVDALAA